jgi:hypothetical protein
MRCAYQDGLKPSMRDAIKEVLVVFLIKRGIGDMSTYSVLEYFSQQEGIVGEVVTELYADYQDSL